MSKEKTEAIYNKIQTYCDQHGIELGDDNFDTVAQAALTAEEFATLKLPEDIQQQLDALVREGDQCAKQGDFESAISIYHSAWDLLPEPQTDWNASTWILAAIGDANFFCEDYENGIENFTLAMKCPEANGNPFLHLRLGQCLFEVNRRKEAADQLTRAYMSGGKEIFAGENKKYFQFLKSEIAPPAGGW